MLESLAIIGGAFVVIVAPAVLILWLRDKFRDLRSRESDIKRQQRLEAWRERMIRPMVADVEELCESRIPNRLIAMYSDHELVLSRNFEVCAPEKDPQKNSCWIGDFVPLHVHDQELTCDLTEFGKGVCFAGDGMGNFYWMPVDVVPKEDAPVYFACHDPWGNEKVADSLNEFLARPRIGRRNQRV